MFVWEQRNGKAESLTAWLSLWLIAGGILPVPKNKGQ